LPLSEGKRPSEEFASLVSCLIGQFALMGALHDAHITIDQVAVLSSAFSEALHEIQSMPFRPISRQYVLEKRGPLFRPKTSFEDRRIRQRNEKTLTEIIGPQEARASNREEGWDVVCGAGQSR
jgi:hypothetical protein